MARIASVAGASTDDEDVAHFPSHAIELAEYPPAPRPLPGRHPDSAHSGSTELKSRPVGNARQTLKRRGIADPEKEVRPPRRIKYWAQALLHRSLYPRSRESTPKMKFSHSLQFNAVPDWTAHYISYSNLKKLCVPDLPAAQKLTIQNIYPGKTSRSVRTTSNRRRSRASAR